tara:strand:+ start:476 stop:1003 length:528 start_codon:yes stop_codon:yes gene_type:complete
MFTRDQLRTSLGVKKGQALWRELSLQENRDAAIFCLNVYDRDGVVSLYRLFQEYAVDDPTEYTFAMAVFGEWAFWADHLCKKTPVKEVIAAWRNEAEVARKSKLVAQITESTYEDKTKFTASKYLLENGYKARPNFTETDGRSSRAADKKTTEETFAADQFQQDYERLTKIGAVN